MTAVILKCRYEFAASGVNELNIHTSETKEVRKSEC